MDFPHDAMLSAVSGSSRHTISNHELPRVIAYAISRGFKGVLSDSWGFTSPISGLVRITYISEQIGSLSSHHTLDVL